MTPSLVIAILIHFGIASGKGDSKARLARLFPLRQTVTNYNNGTTSDIHGANNYERPTSAGGCNIVGYRGAGGGDDCSFDSQEWDECREAHVVPRQGVSEIIDPSTVHVSRRKSLHRGIQLLSAMRCRELIEADGGDSSFGVSSYGIDDDSADFEDSDCSSSGDDDDSDSSSDGDAESGSDSENNSSSEGYESGRSSDDASDNYGECNERHIEQPLSFGNYGHDQFQAKRFIIDNSFGQLHMPIGPANVVANSIASSVISGSNILAVSDPTTCAESNGCVDLTCDMKPCHPNLVATLNGVVHPTTTTVPTSSIDEVGVEVGDYDSASSYSVESYDPVFGTDSLTSHSSAANNAHSNSLDDVESYSDDEYMSEMGVDELLDAEEFLRVADDYEGSDL